MAKLIYCIVACVALNSIRFSFFSDYLGITDIDKIDSLSWHFAVWGEQASTGIFIYYALSIMPWRRVNERCILSLALIWQLSDCACYWFWYFYPDAMFFSWPFQVLCMSAWFAWLLSRRPIRESDPVNPGNIHICIGKPTKIRGSLASVVGIPAGSVSIYADGKIWSYQWGKKLFGSRIASSEVVNRHHTIIDTGIAKNAEKMMVLRSLVGKPARRWETAFLRISCVYTLKPLLSMLGKKYDPSGLKYIPSVYARSLQDD